MEGEFITGKLKCGTRTSKDEWYEGSFIYDMRDGVGSYHNKKTSEKYDGSFKYDRYHGKG